MMCTRGYLATGGWTGRPGGRNRKERGTMQEIHRSSTTWLARRTGRASHARPSHRSHRRRLTLEPLEGRALLSLTTWTVNSLGDSGTGTGNSGDLRYVITQADRTTGDNTVNFSVTGTITLNSALPDLSNTTGLMDIEGPGASSLTVARSSASGTPDFRILTVDGGADVKLVGLTITGGFVSQGNGGGIDNGGTMIVTNSTVANNSAYLYGSNSGYIIAVGGGIGNNGTLTVTNSTIDNNLTTDHGEFGNSTGASGGGIGNNGTLTVTNSTIDNNLATAGMGGGIYNYFGTVSITNTTIADNSANPLLTPWGSLYGQGGGIDNYAGPLTVTSCNITGNSAGVGGGGIENDGNGITLTVTNSTIADNSAGNGGGGGIENWGTLTVANSTIADNAGGILNWWNLTVTNSTIDNNSGEGIENDYGTVSITNTTIADNSTGFGIGNNGTLTVTNCTIAYNWGGILCYSTEPSLDNVTLEMDNTIVALNETSDIFGIGLPVTSGAYNLIGTGGSGGLVNGTNGNQVGVADPEIGPLSDNGGPTQTIALLPGSPAVDAGSNALAVDPTTGLPLTTDQRGPGFARIVNGTVDIGAFEVQATNHLAVTAQAPGSVTAGSGFGFTVTAEDSSGNLLTSFNGTVTVALESNPGGATLEGTLSVTAQNGVATFSDLTLNKAGTGYTLLVSGTGLAGATTAAINVTPAAASQIVVMAQPPSSVLAGSGFGLVVTAEDPFDNVDTNFDGSVAVALLNNPGSATLGGAPSVSAQNGVATFSGLTINELGVGFTLSVSSSGLTSATTSAFNVQTTVSSSVGVNWGTSGSAMLQTASDGLRLLPAGRNTDLPWLGIWKLEITLGQAATLAAGDISAIGSSGTNYGPVTVSGSGTSYTITLAQPINAADRVTITIGNDLIASFTRRLDVLPGDVNDDGVVNVQDMVAIRNQMLGLLGAVPTIFGDINGDGKVDILDYDAVRMCIGTTLPRST